MQENIEDVWMLLWAAHNDFHVIRLLMQQKIGRITAKDESKTAINTEFVWIIRWCEKGIGTKEGWDKSLEKRHDKCQVPSNRSIKVTDLRSFW